MTELREQVQSLFLAAVMVLSVVAVSVTFAGTAVAESGSLTFNDQALGSDGAVTVEDVSTGQNSTIVVTYTNQSGAVIVAGLANADNLSGQDVSVAIEDTGGFPGEHTAWVFDDADVPSGLGIGDTVPQSVAQTALDSETARVDAASGSLTFNDQTLGSDGAVTVENVSTDQNSTIVVTYTNQSGAVIVAGLANSDNLNQQDVSVAIEDTGGFPGEHTAWVFNDEDLPPGLGIGATVPQSVAQKALDQETTLVSEQPSGSLTFNDQALGSDGAVTVEDVSTDQNSTIVVTYTNESSGEVVVAGLANADNLSGQDVSVAIEDTGGFPGEHTAWVFADADLEGLSLAPGDDVLSATGLDPSGVQDLALDLESAQITAASGELSFDSQKLASDGTVTVENVSTGQPSTVVVTYTDGNNETIAGLANADNLDGQDVKVTIEDTGGFPGEHTAWVFANEDLPNVGIGDDATPVASRALDSESAVVSPSDEPVYYVDIENDGGTYTVGFPGTLPDGVALGDLILDDKGYQLYAYDSDSNSWRPLTGSEGLGQTPDALDAIVIATDGQTGPDEITVRIPLEASERGGVAEREVDAGWNFIAASQFGSAEGVFEGTVDATAVQDRYAAGQARADVNAPIDQPAPFVEQIGTNTYTGAGGVPSVDPFKGYFVFFDGDGAIPVLAGGVEDIDDANATLGVELGVQRSD